MTRTAITVCNVDYWDNMDLLRHALLLLFVSRLLRQRGFVLALILTAPVAFCGGQVQVYTRTPFTAIDALQVVSTPRHAQCQHCQPISYRVFRRPGMSGQYFRLSQDTQFTDQ